MSRRLRRWPVVGAILIITACSRDAFMEPRDMRSGRLPATDSTAAVEAGASIGLKLGETRVLQLSGLLRNRTTEWVSSNPASVSVNSTGTIRANSPGQAVIKGTNGGVSQTFNVSVLAPNAAVTGFELSSADSGPLAPGGTRQFMGTATWSDGVTRAVDVEYAATGGTMTAGGLYTAGGVTGTFMVIANCLCGGFSDTVAVEISAIAPPVRQLQKLTISPKTVELEPGVPRQFTVTANWSTGATDVPPVTWSATGGSVSGSGLYVAPVNPGTYRVVVAHVGGTVRDSANITVISRELPPEQPRPAWTIVRDFNSGVLGSVAQRTSDGFDDVAGGSVYSSEYSVDGSQSVKLSIAPGTTGWGTWGGAIKFPRKMVVGDELTIEFDMLMPFELDLPTLVASSKFVRVATKTAAGDNSGYNDLYFASDAGRSGAAFRFIKELQYKWFPMGRWTDLTLGEWHHYEIRLNFDSVPKASGGGGRLRVWFDGELLCDEDKVQTLTNSSDYAWAFYLFTYFNNTAPKLFYLWVDNIRIAGS